MKERLTTTFAEALNIQREAITDELAYSTIPQWDSVAHMVLIAAIEEEFDIMIDTEDVIDMSSFSKAVEIINKYI